MTEVLEDGNGDNQKITANPEENVKADEITQSGSEGTTENVETNGVETTPTVTQESESNDI